MERRDARRDETRPDATERDRDDDDGVIYFFQLSFEKSRLSFETTV